MAKIQILDKTDYKLVNMEEKTLAEQVLYSYDVPADTLSLGGTLRITINTLQYKLDPPLITDTTPPQITINTPTVDPTYSSSTTPILVGGTTWDNVAVTDVTWLCAQPSGIISGEADGTDVWTVADLPLEVGTNRFVATAYDADGNTSTAELDITYGTLDAIACGYECPAEQYAEATYNGSSVYAGPAIRVSSASTLDNFTGLVALYIPDQAGIALALYNNQPLSGLTSSQVLDTYNVTLNTSDVLRIESSDTLTTYDVLINGITVISKYITGASLSSLNSCVAFPTVTSVPADTIPSVVTSPEEVVIVKLADQSVTSSTDLVDDNELTFDVGANETWIIKVLLYVTGNSLKYTFTMPSGSTGKFWDPYINYFEADFDATIYMGAGNEEAYVSLVTGDIAGSVRFRWAQNYVSTTPTVLKAYSSLTAYRKT